MHDSRAISVEEEEPKKMPEKKSEKRELDEII
jgi:hypothetical protein